MRALSHLSNILTAIVSSTAYSYKKEQRSIEMPKEGRLAELCPIGVNCCVYVYSRGRNTENVEKQIKVHNHSMALVLFQR